MTDFTPEQRKQAEQEAQLLQVLNERRVDDPLEQFKPHKKQQDFINSVMEGRKLENWFIAANRSGKSDAGAYAGAKLARYGLAWEDAAISRTSGGRIEVRDRATSGWVSALDFATSRDVIQPKYFNNGFVPTSQHPPFIPEYEIDEWRVADQILKLKNGSLIGFKSAESGPGKYQGAEKSYIHFDEEHERNVYNEATIRVGSRPLRIFGTVTLLPPEGTVGGVSWMFDEIIKRWQIGQLPHVALFSASIYENPVIPPDEIRRLEARYPIGSVEHRIRLMGEWLPGLGGARAYSSFDTGIHAVQQPELNPLLPICWTWDFNVEPMVSLIGQRSLYMGRSLFRVHRELILDSGASIEEMCTLFWDERPRYMRELWIYGDATSKGRSRQTGKSDYTLILNNTKGWGVRVKVKVPASNPPVPDRVNSINYALKDEFGQRHIEVDPSCTELISDLEQVRRDPRGGIKKVTNNRDPYSRRTHTSDALGYWVHYEEPVLPTKMITTFGGIGQQGFKIPSPSYSPRT